MLSGTSHPSAPADAFAQQPQQKQFSSRTKSLLGASSQLEPVDGSPSTPRLGRHESTASSQLNPFTSPRPLLEPLQEYHSGYSDEGASSPFSQHRRPRSYPTNLLSSPFRSRTPSPTRSNKQTTEMPLTGDRRTDRAKSSSFSSWRSGTSSATALGMGSIAEDGTSISDHSSKTGAPRDMTPDTTPTGPPVRRQTLPISAETSSKSAVTATANRFMSAISRFTASPPANPTIIDDDEICNLDIEAALFPAGSPTSKDPFSPAAFKNLQSNAVGLLTKMQHACRERVSTLREWEAERGAQLDELEEAQTRAQHLKMQLEGMARKAQEQEQAMKQLMQELAAEKRAKFDEQATREKGITIITDGSVMSEDLGVDEDQRRNKWRKSAGTIRSETSVDTDEESAESESVFSRSRSPTIAPGAFEGSFPDGPTLQHSRIRSLAPPKSRPEQSMNAFQKIIKGMTGDTDESGPETCRNCKGRDASVAWDTVSLLRDENRHLKRRVGDLEVAVEGALDLVNGIGM